MGSLLGGDTVHSHVEQDFLGPAAAAKKFIDRYLALRFPNIASSSSSIPKPSTNTGPIKPEAKASKSTLDALPQGISRGPSPSLPDTLHAAFGPGGKVYQKNREADDTSAWGRSSPAAGSGSHTPTIIPRQRSAGAVTMQVQENKGKNRIDQGGERRKGKDAEKVWDLPKSRAVKRLEGIIMDLKTLQAGEGKTQKETLSPDCFCQGE